MNGKYLWLNAEIETVLITMTKVQKVAMRNWK